MREKMIHYGFPKYIHICMRYSLFSCDEYNYIRLENNRMKV